MPRPGRHLRDAHRRALLLHFGALVLGGGLLAFLNRALTPDRLWVHWPLLAWAALFVWHLVRFEKGTLSTMGGQRKP